VKLITAIQVSKPVVVVAVTVSVSNEARRGRKGDTEIVQMSMTRCEC